MRKLTWQSQSPIYTQGLWFKNSSVVKHEEPLAEWVVQTTDAEVLGWREWSRRTSEKWGERQVEVAEIWHQAWVPAPQAKGELDCCFISGWANVLNLNPTSHSTHPKYMPKQRTLPETRLLSLSWSGTQGEPIFCDLEPRSHNPACGGRRHALRQSPSLPTTLPEAGRGPSEPRHWGPWDAGAELCRDGEPSALWSVSLFPCDQAGQGRAPWRLWRGCPPFHLTLSPHPPASLPWICPGNPTFLNSGRGSHAPQQRALLRWMFAAVGVWGGVGVWGCLPASPKAAAQFPSPGAGCLSQPWPSGTSICATPPISLPLASMIILSTPRTPFPSRPFTAHSLSPWPSLLFLDVVCESGLHNKDCKPLSNKIRVLGFCPFNSQSCSLNMDGTQSHQRIWRTISGAKTTNEGITWTEKRQWKNLPLKDKRVMNQDGIRPHTSGGYVCEIHHKQSATSVPTPPRMAGYHPSLRGFLLEVPTSLLY